MSIKDMLQTVRDVILVVGVILILVQLYAPKVSCPSGQSAMVAPPLMPGNFTSPPPPNLPSMGNMTPPPMPGNFTSPVPGVVLPSTSPNFSQIGNMTPSTAGTPPTISGPPSFLNATAPVPSKV